MTAIRLLLSEKVKLKYKEYVTKEVRVRNSDLEMHTKSVYFLAIITEWYHLKSLIKSPSVTVLVSVMGPLNGRSPL